MRYNLFLISGLLLGLLLASACERDADESSRGASGQVVVNATMYRTTGVKSVSPQLTAVSEKGDTLYMHAEVSDEWPEELSVPETRASLTTGTQFNSGQSGTYTGGFGLSMFSAADGSEWAHNVKYIKSGTVWQAESTPAYWKQTATPKVKFYAYAPYNAAAITSSGNLASTDVSYSDAEPPVVTWDPFTINSSNNQQVDLLVASNLGSDGNGLNGNTNSNLNLTFRHALTAVRFKTAGGLTSGSLTNITIKNVYYQGKFAFAATSTGTGSSSIGSWTPEGTKTNFSLSTSKTVTFASEAYLTDDSQYFLMMPQNISDNSQAQVTVTIGGTEYTYNLSACTAVTAWLPGTTVTYTLSTAGLVPTAHMELKLETLTRTYHDERDFTVTEREYIPDGSTNVTGLHVRSYKETAGVSQALPWKLQVGTSAAGPWEDIEVTADDYLDAFLAISGTGHATDWEDITTSIHINRSPVTTYPAYTFSAAKGTEAAPYNLATGVTNYDITNANTANCYVVDAPGWYCFPLVWGNALVNGAVNPASGYASSPFATLTQNKAYITKAWGASDGAYTLSSPTASIVWCDRTQTTTTPTVDQVSLVESNKYIRFHISNTNLADGNLLIGLFDGTYYIWAWHIWIVGNGFFSNVSNGEYQFLRHNIGELQPVFMDALSAGEAWLRIVSTDDVCPGNSNVVHVYNNARTGTRSNGVLQYQWGNHIPYLQSPPAGVSITPNSGTLNDLVSYSSTHLAQAFPTTFYQTITGNRWGAVSSSGIGSPTYKTILDPSPYGFRVPSNTELSSLVRSGGTDGTYDFTYPPASGSTNLPVSKLYCRLPGGSNDAGYKIGLWSANLMGNGYGIKTASPGSETSPSSMANANGLAIKPVRDEMVTLQPGTIGGFTDEERDTEWNY